MSLVNSEEVLIWKKRENNQKDFPEIKLNAHYMIFYTPKIWKTEYIKDLKGPLLILDDLYIKYTEELRLLIKRAHDKKVYDNVYIVFPPIKDGRGISMNFILSDLKYLGIEEKDCIFIDSENYEKLHMNNKNKEEREKVLNAASGTWTLRNELRKGNNFYIYVDDITTASSTVKFVIRFLNSNNANISKNETGSFLRNVCSFTLARTLKISKYINICDPALSKKINDEADSKVKSIPSLKDIFG